MGDEYEYVENTWKCSACGVTLQGRHIKCPNCLKVLENEAFDTSGNAMAPTVTDPALLELAKQGSHWRCQYCGGQVRNAEGKCAANCGGDKPAEPVYRVPEASHHNPNDYWPCPSCKGRVSNELGQCPSCGDEKPARRPRLAGYGDLQGLVNDHDDFERVRRSSSSRGKIILIAVGIVAAIAALIAVFAFLFGESDVRVDVKSVGWTCRADLIHRTQHSGEGWEKHEPSGAFNESCRSRQNGTRDCEPYKCNIRTEKVDCNPYECNCTRGACTDQGNGFSKCEKNCETCYKKCDETKYDTCYRQCPNMENWCTYDYYTYATAKTLQNSAADTKVACPVLTAYGPDDRVEVTEHYEVRFANRTDSWNYTPSGRGDLARFEVGDRWHLAVNRVGGVRVIDRN